MRQKIRENNNLINRITARFSGWMRRLWNKVTGSPDQATTHRSTLSDAKPELIPLLSQPIAQGQSARQTSAAPLVSLFAALPDEITAQMLPQLQVKILEGDPTERQQKEVLAFNAYHLIVVDAASEKYRIGFCKKGFFSRKIEYVTQPLGEKSSLFSLVTEPQALSEESMKKNRLLAISFMEQEIEKAGGFIRPVGALEQCRILLRARKGSHTRDVILEEASNKLLHHVAYGEEAQVEKMLIEWRNEKRKDRRLLLSQKGSVTDCSRVRTFSNITPFQLAVRNGDWSMYNMMLKYIPKNERADFLKQQLKELENAKFTREELKAQGLTENDLKKIPFSISDNLYHCGLRVLEGDPTAEQQADVIKRNAYHLILEKTEGRITNCSIGFYDAQSKKYVRRPVSDDMDGLKQFVRNQENASLFQRKEGYSFLVTRDKALLDLARKEINKKTKDMDEREVNGVTEEAKWTTLEADIELLRVALTDYARTYHTVSEAEHIRSWCVLVGWAQRLLPANAWQWWMSRDINWLSISAKDFQRSRPVAPITYDGSLLPLSSSIGVNGSISISRFGGDAGVAIDFLNSFCQVASENYQTLNKQLAGPSPAPLVAGFAS